MAEDKAFERLFDRGEADDVRGLSPEEREAIADALVARFRDGEPLGDAPLSPRSQTIALELAAAPEAAETCDLSMVVETLAEPAHGKGAREMSADELEHEIERRRKYWPSRL